MTYGQQLRQQGMQQGMQQGIQQGAQKTYEAVVREMVQAGFESDMIAKITKLPRDTIAQLTQQLKGTSKRSL